LDATDAHGRTAAMHAIEAGHTSTVGLLLERGCSIHARDAHGNTMLHLLGRHPRKCLINRLLEAGLSLEDKNREELRPIEVAIECGQLTAVDAFLRRGARLRTLTWQIALATHPPLILVLLRKLLDDAQILLRRKRAVEAMHRLKYAQQKCDEFLALTEDGANPKEALLAIRPQLKKYKVRN
jgi:ankyrin repeat protein